MSEDENIDEIRGLAKRWTKEAEGHVATVSRADGHGGPGWYWWVTEYPDEGSVGPFDTRDEARRSATASDLFFALTEDETSVLRGWAAREMTREAERRERQAITAPERYDATELWRMAHDREALARHIACLLGGDFDTLGDDGQHYVVGGLAWSLCEWAGWPS